MLVNGKSNLFPQRLSGWGAAGGRSSSRGTAQAAGAGGAVLTRSLSLSHKCHQLVVGVAAARSQGCISHDSLES